MQRIEAGVKGSDNFRRRRFMAIKKRWIVLEDQWQSGIEQLKRFVGRKFRSKTQDPIVGRNAVQRIGAACDL